MNFWMKQLLGGLVYEGEDGSGGGAPGAGAGDGAAPAGTGKPAESGGTDAAAGAGNKEPGSGDARGSGDKAGEGDGAKPDEGKAAEPVAYVDDPNKTPEENAAAKAEHERAEKAKPYFGAPEKYGDFEIPEGVQLDQDAANELFALGKELNLSQAAIDKLIEIQAGVYARSAEATGKEWTDTVKGWTDTVKADKDFGGANYEKNMGLAAHARSTFGSPELNAWLDETQLGSHPELVKFMVSVGQAMGEGKSEGGGVHVQSEDAATILYDHPTSKVT